jgi:hypothetical protein
MYRLMSYLILAGALVGCDSMTDPATLPSEPAHAAEFSVSGLPVDGPEQPTIFHFTASFDFVIPAGESGPRTTCPFAIHVEGQDKVIVQRFDTYIVFHNVYTSTLTNLTTGFAFQDNGDWKDIDRFGQPNVTTVGSNFRITIPGRGMVGQDTGIITVNNNTGEVLFEGGPHENFQDPELVCTLLSGGA